MTIFRSKNNIGSFGWHVIRSSGYRHVEDNIIIGQLLTYYHLLTKKITRFWWWEHETWWMQRLLSWIKTALTLKRSRHVLMCSLLQLGRSPADDVRRLCCCTWKRHDSTVDAAPSDGRTGCRAELEARCGERIRIRPIRCQSAIS